MRLLFADYHEAPSRTWKEVQNQLSFVCGCRYIGHWPIVLVIATISSFSAMIDLCELTQRRSLVEECVHDLYGVCTRLVQAAIAGARLSRDLQMVNLVLRIEHGALLTFAAITGEPLLLAPWLAVESGTLLVCGLSMVHSAGQMAFSGKPIELRLHWGPTCNLLWRIFSLVQVICLMAKQMHWC